MNNYIFNQTNASDLVSSSIFSWCFLLPLAHAVGLISNLLCIIVFCSKGFIKKPIAIYFICLLMSDSVILLNGYIEMIDRESSMIDKSSWLCVFNVKIVLPFSEFLFHHLERYCIEWMLYKVLWIRVSTILLAILSVQRTRTFFSLSYHESRTCAIFACIFSITIALLITCFEWTGLRYDKVENPMIYSNILQLFVNENPTNESHSIFLAKKYNVSTSAYPCAVETLNTTAFLLIENQFNCSTGETERQLYNITKVLMFYRDSPTSESEIRVFPDQLNVSNYPILYEHRQIIGSLDFIHRLYDNSTCRILIRYSWWLKTFDFFTSQSLKFNRYAVAIFFGNALPSFIVVSANLLSLKVIYFSKNLKYLKQTTRTNHRKRRLQNDLRAFLVIIIQSFSTILISWGIPIFLTTYHCRTLYVDHIRTCPKIQDYLILFLCNDLINSATNCLLYSLSGKLFRRKLIGIVKAIFVCGRGTLWHVKRHSLLSRKHAFDRQLSNNPSTNTNHPFYGAQSSRPGSCQHLERLSSPVIVHSYRNYNNSIKTTMTHYNHTNGLRRNMSDDVSYSIGRTSDDRYGGRNSSSDIESDNTKKLKEMMPRKSTQSIGSFLLEKVRSFGSTSSASSKATSVYPPSSRLTVEVPKLKSKKKRLNSTLSKREKQRNESISTSSFSNSVTYGSQRKYVWTNHQSASQVLINNTIDNPSIIRVDVDENLTSL